MTSTQESREDLLRQVEELRTRAEEAEAVLAAVRAGEVDAFVVGGPAGEQVFTLQGADEPYRFAVEQMNAGTATLSADGIVLYCNNRLAEMVERAPGEVVGKAFESFIRREEGPVWRGLLEKGLSLPCGGETSVSDGGMVPLQVWLSPMPRGMTASVCLVAVDLTEIREREERLLRLEAMRDAAERVGLVGSWTVDLRARTVTWSPGVFTLFDLDLPSDPDGYALALDGELVKLVSERIHRDDLPLVDLFATPALERAHGALDFRVVHRDGGVHDLHAHGSAELGPDGRPERVVGFLQDVTDRVRTERRLRLDESRQRALVEGVPDVVFQLDREHRLVSANERFHQVVGAIRGRRLQEGESVAVVGIPEHVRELWAQGHARALATGPFVEEISEELPGGTVTWETYFTPVMVDDEAVGVVYAARDVTQQRRAQQALRDSEATRDLAERIGRVMSWTLDLKTGRTTWSPGVHAIYDLDDRDVGNDLAGDFGGEVQRAILAHIVPEDLEMAQAHTRELLDSATYTPFDFRIRRRDGSVRVVHSAGRVATDDQGRPVRVVGYHQDVTEQVRAMEELRHSEAMRDAAERVGRLASWTTDLRTGQTTWSDGVYALYDLDRPAGDAAVAPGDLMAAVLSRLARDDRELMVRRVKNPAASGALPSAAYRVRHRDGSEHLVAGVAEVENDADGRPVRLVGYHQDVTEQRRAEDEIRALNADLERRVRERTAELAARTVQVEATAERLRAANDELESFSYSVSHDLRAPLRAIDGFSEILIEDYAAVLDEAGLGHLARIRDGAQRMGQLIDDLLALSRIGREDLEPADVDLSAVAASLLAELCADAGSTAHVTVTPGLHALADRGLVTILLTNLLGNAVKFTAHEAAAHIEVGAREQDGATAFFVRDDGAGFDASRADDLFRPFSRLHDQSEFAGSGIGLAIVQRIVARHGGRCWAEGAVGAGATFFFTLPAPIHPGPG